MKPTCGHWSECGLPRAGCCARNLYGGKPSFGVCNVCVLNPGRGRQMDVSDSVPTPEELAKAEADRIAQFHKTWDYIHRESLAPDGLTADKISIASTMLPCGECKEHFAKMVADEVVPVRFAITVGWHNVVNAWLAKPLVTLEEARKLYAPP